MAKYSKYHKEIKKSPYYIRVYTPTVIQMETVECGAACLGSILGFYGKFLPLEKLRRNCKVSRDGSSIYNIIKAAENYGLISEVHRVELENLYQMPVPLIAFWGLNHFVVIEGFSRTHVYIMDPAIGKLKISYEDLNNYFSGVIIIFDRTTEFKKSGHPPSLTEKLKKIASAEWKSLALAGCLGIGQVIPLTALAFVIQYYIDHLNLTNFIWKYGFVFFLSVITLLKFLLCFAESTILNNFYLKLSIRSSKDFLWHILRLPYGFYISNHIGEMGNRIQLNDVVYKSLTSNLVVLIINAAMVIPFVAIICFYDALIGSAIVSIIVFEVLLMFSFKYPRGYAYSYYQQALMRSTSYGLSALYNMETIKSGGMEQKIFGKWIDFNTQKLKAIQQLRKRDSFVSAVYNFLGFCTLAIVIGLGAYQVMHGYLTLGMLFALIMLTGYVIKPILLLVDFGQLAHILQFNLSRLEDVINYPLDLNVTNVELQSSDLTEKSKVKDKIELAQVSFGYELEKDPILQNLVLCIKPGETIAVVGRSGAGKSTFIKLLSGLITPVDGAILWGNKYFHDVSRDEIINSLATVDQKPFIFHASVKDNITFFNPSITLAEVIQAAKNAKLHEDLSMWEEGYERILEENGTNLSGGQRQKIELARAFVRKPTLLLLDEATSSLDTETEYDLIQNIKSMGCTCIIASHRFSIARLCDTIIVLNKGKIEMQGTHELLYAKNNLYKELYDIEQNNGII